MLRITTVIVLLAAALPALSPAPAQGHLLKCKPWGKITKAKHRCHVRQAKHAAFALRWAHRHTQMTGAATVKKNHRWLRAQMLRRIRVFQSRLELSLGLPWAFWSCVATGRMNGRQVSDGEGGADSVSPGGTYHGRYQMDRTFERTHGKDMLRKYGGARASRWSLLDQTIVAERGFKVQGPGAWPNTAPPCMALR